MPDILKAARTGQRTVRIPDVNLDTPPRPVQKPEPAQVPAADFSGVQPDARPEPAGKATVAILDPPLSPESPVRQSLSRAEMKDLYRSEFNAMCEEEALRAYAEARARKAGELKQCIIEVEERMQELEDQQRTYMAEYARNLKYLSVEVAEKFVGEKIDESDHTLPRHVMNTISKAKNANWLTVELSERMIQLISYMKEELQKPEYHGRAEVIPVSALEDTVRVTTDTGTLDATVSVQADNLRDLFHSMDAADAAEKQK